MLQTYKRLSHFEHGNDCKEQPMVLNRNFLGHGMLYRKVIRKDCVMLFLLLYNFTMFLNRLTFCINNGHNNNERSQNIA